LKEEKERIKEREEQRKKGNTCQSTITIKGTDRKQQASYYFCIIELLTVNTNKPLMWNIFFLSFVVDLAGDYRCPLLLFVLAMYKTILSR
jgi:hypothetical protein